MCASMACSYASRATDHGARRSSSTGTRTLPFWAVRLQLAARFPAYKYLSGFYFAASEINEATVRQLHRRRPERRSIGGRSTGKTHVATALRSRLPCVLERIPRAGPQGPEKLIRLTALKVHDITKVPTANIRHRSSRSSARISGLAQSIGAMRTTQPYISANLPAVADRVQVSRPKADAQEAFNCNDRLTNSPDSKPS